MDRRKYLLDSTKGWGGKATEENQETRVTDRQNETGTHKLWIISCLKYTRQRQLIDLKHLDLKKRFLQMTVEILL